MKKVFDLLEKKLLSIHSGDFDVSSDKIVDNYIINFREYILQHVVSINSCFDFNVTFIYKGDRGACSNNNKGFNGTVVNRTSNSLTIILVT